MPAPVVATASAVAAVPVRPITRLLRHSLLLGLGLACTSASLVFAGVGPSLAELENILLSHSEREPQQVLTMLEKNAVLAPQGEGVWRFVNPGRVDGFWKYAQEVRLRDGCVAVSFQGDTGELGPIMKFWTEGHAAGQINRIRNGSFSVKTANGRERKYQFNPMREVVLSCRHPKS